MPSTVPLVIHERVSKWSRQLSPYAAAWSSRLVETRSAVEMREAVARHGPGVLVVGMGNDPASELLAVHEALSAAPQTLSLVIESADRPGVCELARDVGSTAVLDARVLPPEVVQLVRRLVDRAAKRRLSCGWFDSAPGSSPDDLDSWIRSL